ncbi:MAG: histidine kinase, partial [Ruthenibacterium sp.]
LGTMAEYLALTKSHAPETAVVPLSVDGCAEIRAVSKEFNEMFSEQNRLITELQTATITLYETELGKKQAELDFLRSQINPHFLYNTLETMQDIAAERGVPELAQIAGAMGTLFRYNVKGDSVVSLEQELTITRAYLAIQQARFPGRFEIIYSIRPNTLSCPVMKLLFQPLVENAIVHGLEPRGGTGTLYLGAKA